MEDFKQLNLILPLQRALAEQGTIKLDSTDQTGESRRKATSRNRVLRISHARQVLSVDDAAR